MKLRAEVVFVLLVPFIAAAYVIGKLWNWRRWIIALLAIYLFLQWCKQGYDPVTGDWYYK